MRKKFIVEIVVNVDKDDIDYGVDQLASLFNNSEVNLPRGQIENIILKQVPLRKRR